MTKNNDLIIRTRHFAKFPILSFGTHIYIGFTYVNIFSVLIQSF